MADVTNLLAGTPALYIAPFGEALPEIDDLTPPALTITPGGNWVQVGLTKDQYQLNYEPTFEDVEVNEHLGPVDSILVSEAGSLSFMLAENNLQAFEEAINTASVVATAAGVDQVAKDVIGVGDGTVAKKALLLIGTSPEGGSRIIHVPKVVQDSAVAATFAKAHEGMAAGFKFLVDVTQSAGERLFKITDITAVATS